MLCVSLKMKFWQLLFTLSCLQLHYTFVTSQNCTTAGSVRLVDGSYYTEGRLEICHNGLWHTVCADNTYCNTVATVVCRQLGLSTTGVQVYGRALYGEGTGPIGFQNLSCSGAETNITQCNYTSVYSTCPHSMDAGVHCNPTSICLDVGGHVGCCDVHNCYMSFPYNCWCDDQCRQVGDCCEGIDVTCPSNDDSEEEEENEGNEVEIVGSTLCSPVGAIGFEDGGETVGRVLVCDADYRWKTVCSVGFDEREAKVICSSLGLSTENVTIFNHTEYGQGYEDVLPKSLQCNGNESKLTDCSYHNVCCSHHLDVGVACMAACITGDLRLVGGGALEGRLEVCFEGRWGTVCDSNWNVFDARIACKTMNLPWKGAQAYFGSHTNTHYGLATSNVTIWLEQVNCEGTEDNFWMCFGEEDIADVGNCQHINDASLLCGPCDLAGYGDRCCDPNTDGNCQGVTNETVCHCSLDCEDHNDCCIDFSVGCRCTNYDLALRGGTVPNEGRVEMCYNGEWGTVCDDYWNTPDAKVVCRQLGYSTIGATALKWAYFGWGNGQIWLDNVHCTGFETHLINCTANTFGTHNCHHWEDAGVRCAVANTGCTHGQARLVNGPFDREGQLEVCYNGVWGTVCHHWFGFVDAFVACRTIFPYSYSVPIRIPYSYQYFGLSTIPIVMDYLSCPSYSITNIVKCPHITNHNCHHYWDIGLGCYPRSSYNGAPILLPGPSTGRLLVSIGSTTYATVCRDGFGIEDARVVCRELGQPTGSPRVYNTLQFGRGFGSTKYFQVLCSGNETLFAHCPRQIVTVLNSYCTHNDDIGVGCQEACVNGEMRLLGGANITEGRVEVCRDGAWGTICDYDSSWGAEEAIVICKQLGYPYTAAQASSYNEFGPGPDPFHYTDVYCQGDETNFSQCNKSTTIISCTTHKQDVGVICEGVCTPGDVRLVDGVGPNSGRLEICIGGHWGTVCGESFDNLDASIVCKQLGLPYQGAEAAHNALFGMGTDHIAISSVFCHGHENKLFLCLFQIGSAVDCTHDNDVGVVCDDLCENGDIKLVNPNAAGIDAIVTEGRVEVCYNGVWGTVCERGWDTYDARVVCTQLGFNSSSVRTFGGTKYKPGTGPIYFKDLHCIGTETSLIYCMGNTSTTGVCSHSNDAGLLCSGGLLTLNSTQVSDPSLPVPGQIITSNVSSINSTSVTVSWSGPFNGLSIVTGYHILINNRNISVLGNVYSTIISNLSSGIPYRYEITASNLFGVGPKYKSGVFFTVQLRPNSTVKNSNAARVNEYQFFISWIPLNLTEARGFITGYTIQWTPYNGGLTNSTIVLPNITNYTSSPVLYPSYKYTVSVLALTVSGNGPPNPLIVNTTSSVYLQFTLNLLNGESCPVWKVNNTLIKINDIITAITQAIHTRCHTNCTHFGSDHFGSPTLNCNNNSTDNTSASFGVEIFTPASLSKESLTEYIQEWLSSQYTILLVNGVEYIVCGNSISMDTSTVLCPVVIEKEESFVIGASVGGSFGVILVITVGILLIIYLWRKKIGDYNTSKTKKIPTVKYDARKSGDKQVLVQS